MQTDLAREFLRSFTTEAEAQHRLHLLYQVAEELGLLERSDSDVAWSYSYLQRFGDGLAIELSFFSPGLTAGLQLVEASTFMSEFAKHLLPKVGEFRKEFDEQNNKLKLVAQYKGVRIVLESATPKACTVEAVEEVIEVPEKIIPAHTEKKVRWVMKGDCDPLMASPAQPQEEEAQVG